MNTFMRLVKARTKRIEKVLKSSLCSFPKSRLRKVMEYSALSNGKRIRPLLVYLTGETLRADLPALDYPAAAVELAHAFSLIHDDLPALDNDDLRRGRPTCHKVFGEAMAILAGDALLAASAHLLSNNKFSTPSQKILMVECLMKAVGASGMCYGQSLDITVQKKLNLKQLNIIHKNKTGALLKACIQIGVIASPPQSKVKQTHLFRFADKIGLLFQIQDDLLDIIGNQKTLGKQVHSDIKNHKITYPTIIGIKRTREKLLKLQKEALKELQLASLGDSLLAAFTLFLSNRKY